MVKISFGARMLEHTAEKRLQAEQGLVAEFGRFFRNGGQLALRYLRYQG
jgi:hypothetical protein